MEIRSSDLQLSVKKHIHHANCFSVLVCLVSRSCVG